MDGNSDQKTFSTVTPLMHILLKFTVAQYIGEKTADPKLRMFYQDLAESNGVTGENTPVFVIFLRISKLPKQDGKSMLTIFLKLIFPNPSALHVH